MCAAPIIDRGICTLLFRAGRYRQLRKRKWREKKKGEILLFFKYSLRCSKAVLVQSTFTYQSKQAIGTHDRTCYCSPLSIAIGHCSFVVCVLFFFFFFLSQGRRNRSFFFSPNLFVSYLYGTRFIYFFFPFFRSVSFIPNFPLSMKEFSFFLFVGSMDVKKEDTKKKRFLI